MNSHKYNSYLIKSKLLSKNDIIYNHFKNENILYIQNLKDFIDIYIDDNKCNITNNNLLTELLHNMTIWTVNDYNIKKIIYNDMSAFIYNYDIYDNEMYDFLCQFEKLIM